MKFWIVFAFLVLIAAVVPAHATNLNFQNPTDFNAVIQWNGSTNTVAESPMWVESTTGGNNYISIGAHRPAGGCVAGGQYDYNGFMLPSASATTYAAATFLGSSDQYGATVVLLDSNRNLLYNPNYINQPWAGGEPAAGSVVEVKISGGIASYYVNGVLNEQSGVLAQNPSYVLFGTNRLCTGERRAWDNIVYGQTENMNNLGISESDNSAFYILQDVKSNANDGLFNGTSMTQADANYMPYQWSRGNITAGAPLENVSIQLVNVFTGTDYDRVYTGTGFLGSGTFDIKTKLIDAGAPDGYYAITIPGSGAYSNYIEKKSNGASVTWSSKTYSVGDTGAVITVVADGGYWDSDYSYKLAVVDVFGNFYKNTTILTQTSTTTQEWTTSYPQGVYYAWLIATKLSTGREYLLGSDYTTLSARFNIHGYVNADMTAAAIPGVTMNWSQDVSASNIVTDANGYYITDSVWVTGATIAANITKTGYDSQQWTATITNPSSKFINITLRTSPRDFTGLAFGGVVTDSLYHRPLSADYVRLYNTTFSESWQMQTNTAGFYWVDAAATPAGYNNLGSGGGISEGRSTDGTAATLNPHAQAMLTNGRYYCAEAYKIGYANATECRTVVAS